ncbi:glucose-fructose oxidoreductase [Planoprotostelium fungivorum]|nr:glucose-fructose oxidoreductase [Planoprotostelium fungivorum]
MPAINVQKGSKVRYAVVGGGDISQRAFMPGVAQTTNSEMTVLVTGDPEKADKLAKMYNLKSYSYDDFPKLLKEGGFDAVYVATPNWLHRKFAEPALEAGYHVLLEKPMEVTEEDCIAINNASKKSGAKLMVAYRLHCEPGTVEAFNRVRQGELGDPRIFTSTFSQPLKENNHRAKNGFDAGPIPDMGTYQINAVRNLFGMEPLEVSAKGFKTPGRDLDHDDVVTVSMKFPGERVANFLTSYSGAAVNQYLVLGTRGELEAKPSFSWSAGKAISYKTKIEGEEKTHNFPEVDHFAGETDYFSQCIIDGVDPEPDGDEGVRDVRVILAIKKSIETGETVKLEPLESRKHAVAVQVRQFKKGKQPDEMINCEPPAAK